MAEEKTVYSLGEFLGAHREDDFAGSTAGAKEGETLAATGGGRIVQLAVDSEAGRAPWIRPGAAIAYHGDMTFERLPTFTRGVSMREAALREITPLVQAEGRGRLFVAYRGHHARVVQLEAGESVNVAAHGILAFEGSVSHEVFLVRGGVGLAAGGLFGVRLSGPGKLALAAHGDPFALRVAPGRLVTTDPHATLAWSARLTPTLHTDLRVRSLFKHGGGEPFQMRFEAAGSEESEAYVVVQPSEEPGKWEEKFHPLERLKGALGLGGGGGGA